jgi:hypothetical protein
MIVVCSRCLTFVVGHIFVVSNVCSRIVGVIHVSNICSILERRTL